MLWSLMDGTARPAGELTMIAGLSPSAASCHLAHLTEGGLLAMEVNGRHRYYRIATPNIAAAIEAHRAPERGAGRDGLRARTCYAHLAGELAVGVFDAMLSRNWLELAELHTEKQGATPLDATRRRRARVRGTRHRLERTAAAI